MRVFLQAWMYAAAVVARARSRSIVQCSLLILLAAFAGAAHAQDLPAPLDAA